MHILKGLQPRALRHNAARAFVRARVVSEAIVKTGMARQLTPRGLLAMVQQQVQGTYGPSALFRVHAANVPDKLALVGADGSRATFAELDRAIDEMAAGLERQHGLGAGDAIVLMLRNRPEMIVLQTAMSRLGGKAVCVSWRSTVPELEYLVNHSGARAIVVEADLADVVQRARPQLGSVPARNFFSIGGDVEGLAPLEGVPVRGGAPRTRADSGGAVVIYTSGTTGKPKGAVREFPRDAFTAILRFVLETPLRAGDRHLVVCPMYHSAAFGFIGISYLLSATIYIEPHFDPESFLRAVERHRITTTAVVPTMLHRLLQLPESTARRYDTSSLTAVFCGGAALTGSLARSFIERFGPVLYNFYGATETGINTVANSEELLAAPGTIGHLVPGNEIRLLDENGRAVPYGTTGELFVRNDMLVAGYHRDEGATRSSMREGFFGVGDLAHRDRRGLYHLDGRKRDMIISGGVNVYPAEVEDVLHRHPAVLEAAVIGVPDDEWGERVQAFVALQPGAVVTEGDLVQYCKSELAGPKVPRKLVVLEELPKNPTGKILKRELREIAKSASA